MRKNTVAYTAPFVTFLVLLGLSGLVDSAHLLPAGSSAKYFIFPLQTLVCAGVLAWFWPQYRLCAPRKAWIAVGIGALIFGLWVWVFPPILQRIFHQPPRLIGFDPGVFAGQPMFYWGEVVIRFARLVLVVPVLEEIFWRGFLLRYLINEEFEAVPFGTYARLANAAVAIGFMLEHSYPDWPAALVTGFAYNFVACRTRSLSSCIVAHALTNALLGVFIMATRQWGFW